jgi:hypothetical protein
MYFTVKENDFIVFTYTNWKGETGERKAIIKEFFFGANDYHPEVQFMIRAFDVDKLAERTFAAKDIEDLRVIKVHA